MKELPVRCDFEVTAAEFNGQGVSSTWMDVDFVEAFFALLIPFNLVEKYELSRYLKRLQEVVDKSGSAGQRSKLK